MKTRANTAVSCCFISEIFRSKIRCIKLSPSIASGCERSSSVVSCAWAKILSRAATAARRALLYSLRAAVKLWETCSHCSSLLANKCRRSCKGARQIDHRTDLEWTMGNGRKTQKQIGVCNDRRHYRSISIQRRGPTRYDQK